MLKNPKTKKERNDTHSHINIEISNLHILIFKLIVLFVIIKNQNNNYQVDI